MGSQQQLRRLWQLLIEAGDKAAPSMAPTKRGCLAKGKLSCPAMGMSGEELLPPGPKGQMCLA